jgi:nicotinate-nucleotide adenylyltransferase
VRLGVFGGTFDPPHVGHLLVASDAFEALELDRLAWIPARQQPLKAVGGTSAEHRLAMVRLSVQNDPRFVAESIEIDRPGLSYTVETLRGLRAQHPAAALHLLLGADAAALLPKWREPEGVLSLARLVVLGRAGDAGPVLPPELEAVAVEGPGAPIRLAVRRVDVSSTEIRARLAEGRSVRGFVPESVADYCSAHGLYRGKNA